MSKLHLVIFLTDNMKRIAEFHAQTPAKVIQFYWNVNELPREVSFVSPLHCIDLIWRVGAENRNVSSSEDLEL